MQSAFMDAELKEMPLRVESSERVLLIACFILAQEKALVWLKMLMRRIKPDRSNTMKFVNIVYFCITLLFLQ